MSVWQTLQLATIMEACDQDGPAPAPVVGEAVSAYWIRVLKYQVWQKGFEAGLSEQLSVNLGCEPTSNPYKEPNL